MEKKNIQSEFLTQLQQEQKPVTIITINGFQLKGQIIGHDQFTLLVESRAGQHLVYKSAVSTIVKEG